MSTQSGITASPELLQAFAQAQQDSLTRALVIYIENERLVPGDNTLKSNSSAGGSAAAPASAAAEEFQQLGQILKENQPCYVAYKLDAPTEWLLVAWVPTSAAVKAKMLVASTQATLVKELGQGHFTDQLFASDKEDLTADGWKRHLDHKAAKAPRTEREEEAEMVKKMEGLQTQGTSVRRSDLGAAAGSGVGAPWAENAEQAVTAFASGSAKALYLTMDVPSETVVLLDESSSSFHLPADQASWSFYRSQQGSIVFIYSCPSGSPVKSRMIFSSNTQHVAKKAQTLGLDVAKKIETSDPAEITESYIASELDEDASAAAAASEPASLSANKAGGFAKPRRPGRR